MTALSPFSPHNPWLQTAWDATSLRALMFCPRSYQLSILQGWRGNSVDLEFGGFFASAVEVFSKSLLGGASKEDATLAALKHTVETSYGWGGEYIPMWKCAGKKKYKNAKGNAAKCPYSHKNNWFPEPAPSICGECGSELLTATRFMPLDKKKNRVSLVRLVVAYCDAQVGMDEDGIKPYKFPDGTLGVELSFKLPLPWQTKHGDTYILCGHMDRVVENSNAGEAPKEIFATDNKTTGKALGAGFWAGFSPDIQVDTYDFAMSTLFPDLPFAGVLIEGAQLLVGHQRLGVGFMRRTEAQRQEYFENLKWWLEQAERFAEEGFWPMNRGNCWLCKFKGVCSKDPSQREMYLNADFVRKEWNPLEER